MTNMPPAPRAPAKNSQRTLHGVTLSDDFAWLRADNWRDVMRDPACLDPTIRKYLDTENDYSAEWLNAGKGLQRRLVKEMRGRILEDDSTVPSTDGPFAYYTRFREGGQHPLICRRPSGDTDGANEQLLLDGDKLAKRKSFFEIGSTAHSPDHTRLAWSCDVKGSELHTIRVRDLATGEDLGDKVTDTSGEIVWSADGNALYYVALDAEHRPSKVFRHRIGTKQGKDELIYEEPDAGFFIGIDSSQSGDFLIIDAHGHTTSECHLVDLHDNTAMARCVAPRVEGEEYTVEHHTDRLFILTNSKARDFRIMETPLATSGREHWREIVGHREGCYILDMIVLRDYLVRMERENGLPRIIIRQLADGSEHSIDFPEEAYSLGMGAGYEFATDTLRFIYSSMTTPAETYDYDMRTRNRVLRKRQDVPCGHDSSKYVTRRVFARACDGETVPVSLLYHKDTRLDGSAPVFLYAYGSYGYSIGASFRSNPLSLVNRGFIYAIAHVRGGTEKGRRWYDEGKRERKPNTFSDFIAAAEHLIGLGLTKRGRIVANGGSAGGMLMGAIANLRPDLFAGIVAEVPFVDVLTTMLDDTLPLTPPEWPEWGNPIEDPKAFAWIRAYSPYDNVGKCAYPAIFALGGLTDPRVTYWEPAKWVAKLRANNTSDNPILLRINMDAGHAGASGRFDALGEVAMVYAFALDVTGMKRAKLLG